MERWQQLIVIKIPTSCTAGYGDGAAVSGRRAAWRTAAARGHGEVADAEITSCSTASSRRTSPGTSANLRPAGSLVRERPPYRQPPSVAPASSGSWAPCGAGPSERRRARDDAPDWRGASPPVAPVAFPSAARFVCPRYKPD